MGQPNCFLFLFQSHCKTSNKERRRNMGPQRSRGLAFKHTMQAGQAAMGESTCCWLTVFAQPSTTTKYDSPSLFPSVIQRAFRVCVFVTKGRKTVLLSQRWQHLWPRSHLPECLRFHYQPPHCSSIHLYQLSKGVQVKKREKHKQHPRLKALSLNHQHYIVTGTANGTDGHTRMPGSFAFKKQAFYSFRSSVLPGVL